MANSLNSNVLSEAFFYLQADPRHKAGQLLTRVCKDIPGIGQLLIGLDQNDQRHLLIPISGTSVVTDLSSEGTLQLSVREAGLSGQLLDLTCTEPTLSFVFERLCSDIIERLTNSPGSPISSVKSTLHDWKALFAGPASKMNRESLVGLIGELEILALLAKENPLAAIEGWMGPSGAIHDFSLDGITIEVKCTSSLDGNRVSISNLDQLDASNNNLLYLAVVHLLDKNSGPSVDDRIRSLIELGVPAHPLIQKTAAYGHVFESGFTDAETFEVNNIRFWVVSEDFPSLRRSDVSASRLRGIEKVKYDLLLDAAGEPLTNDEYLDLEKKFARDR